MTEGDKAISRISASNLSDDERWRWSSMDGWEQLDLYNRSRERYGLYDWYHLQGVQRIRLAMTMKDELGDQPALLNQYDDVLAAQKAYQALKEEGA